MIPSLKAKLHESYQTNFIRNGGVLLEELITFCNGKSNIPIRHFSADELMKATNNYVGSPISMEPDCYKLYKGSLKDHPIIVKKYNDPLYITVSPYKDIAIGSQMSVHKNVLKVLGCCLETKTPIIVYEFVGTKLLSECISSATNVEPLPWKCRLKIARDLASAIAYLHTAFSTPVIHRDIKSKNVILDENNVPKLIDFGLCISIPEGESRIQDVLMGTVGYVAPDYLTTGYVTEKVDVYSFGVVLLELLSGTTPPDLFTKLDSIMENGKPCIEKLNSVVDCRITNEGIEEEQLQDFITLLVGCISWNEEERPTMVNVAKQLRQFYQSFPSPCLA
ncbi:hypothetical protein COLO4_10474 [Corchorus olitorius]|uniref:Protein kinase domain-containing protein n=1 Tax=Corchorus olitorius TaxID=93759 RepID=A0A1R3K8D3_9ROSI|nr:hypothetical protein COLO4_10474 [Corchorus olitorius]